MFFEISIKIWTPTTRGDTLLFAGFKETSVIQAGGGAESFKDIYFLP